MATAGSPFKVDWHSKEAVIDYAKEFRHTLLVIWNGSNYQITFPEQLKGRTLVAIVCDDGTVYRR